MYLKYAVVLLLCGYMSSCHIIGDSVEGVVDNVISKPDYDASFTINGEKTKQTYRNLRLIEESSAAFDFDGENFKLVFSTSPYYLDTSKALSSFEFSVMTKGEPEIGKKYRISGDEPSKDIEGYGFTPWIESGVESWVMCKMMWAPLCKFLDNEEAKTHQKDRIILVSDTAVDGWLRFDKINYLESDKIEIEVSFELSATVRGGENDDVVIPVTLSKGKLKYYNVFKYMYVSPSYTPWFENWKKYVPKDYFLSKSNG